MTKILGIVIPRYAYSQNALSLLATDGKLWPLQPGPITERLRNFLWDTVLISANRHRVCEEDVLEVIYFEANENFQEIEMPSPKNSNSTSFRKSG